MKGKPPVPIFSLRGHQVGVTSLCHFTTNVNEIFLVSGDEEGSIIIWDLVTYRKLRSFPKLVPSRVQHLEVTHLPSENGQRLNVLVVQSRDDGVHIYNLDQECQLLIDYPTYKSLFSRCHVRTISEDLTLLAHPAYLENFLVTVRAIGSGAKTIASGTAKRSGATTKCGSVFDMKLLASNDEGCSVLAVAYEDGHLCMFKCACKDAKIDINMVKDYDLKIGDFISAFDALIQNDGIISLICGTPLKKLFFIKDPIDGDSTQERQEVTLSRQGVSSIKIRPDRKLVAIAGWDHSVSLYSAKTYKLLAKLNHHLKLVQCIHFVKMANDPPENQDKFLLCCASLDGTISLNSIY